MTWRQYDNALGRFHGVDAMAAMTPSQTPYHFAGNNPIYFSDPTGLYQLASYNGRQNMNWVNDFNTSSFDFGDLGGGSGGGGGGSGAAITSMFSNSGNGSTTWNNDNNGYFSSEAGITGYGGSFYTHDEWNSFGEAYAAGTELNSVEVTYQGSYGGAGNSIAADIRSRSPYDNYNQADRSMFGNGLSQINEKFNFGKDFTEAGSMGYLSTKGHSFKRHIAHKISEILNIKSGALFQNGQRIARGASKLAKRAGPLGNILTGATISYELTTNTWDAHTFVDGAMLATGVVATVFLASNPVGWAILGGIAVYGVLDVTFGVNDAIDNSIGRNSSICD